MKKHKISLKVKKRMNLTFMTLCILISLLTVRLGYIQVINKDEYSKKALESQTRDIPIPAKRGIIYDRNGKELAVSAVTYTIWARPSLIKESSKTKTENELMNEAISTLSENLSIPEEEIRKKMNSGKQRPKIAKYVDKKIAEKIQKENIIGIEMDENVKRYYPLGSFASQVLGSVTDDNHGLAGLELEYDKELRGVPGRRIKVTDKKRNSLAGEKDLYYKPQDGLNLYLTIDEVIQHYVEKSLAEVQKTTKADKIMCIAMNPKNGEILAMAMIPEYDPNIPRIPLDEEEAQRVESLNDDEKMKYWNTMWRNPMVSDTFEPGSTFKLLTTSMALEEGVAKLNDQFICKGTCQIADKTIKCWRWRRPHGVQTLLEGVGNSCNPVFVQLVKKIGKNKFYEYLNDFGFSDITYIDYPGESGTIMYDKDDVGMVELATMSYGHSIATTPLQMITALSCFGNDGKIVQPRLVKKLVDRDENIIREFKTKVVRQVLSKKTIEEMQFTMESVVEDSGGKSAKIKGYRIGGKSGTALKAVNGKYTDATYASFFAMAPMENPQISILLAIDNPKNSIYGSVTAGPGVKMILEDTLRYLDVKPNYTQEERNHIENQKIYVDNFVGKSFEEAIKIIEEKKISYEISPKLSEKESIKGLIVIDQYPKNGNTITSDEKIYLYRK